MNRAFNYDFEGRKKKSSAKKQLLSTGKNICSKRMGETGTGKWKYESQPTGCNMFILVYYGLVGE